MEQFVTKLQLLAKDSSFKDQDEMIRDRIVFGTNSQKVREKLINEKAKLTLARAIEIARNYESAKQQLQSMGKKEDSIYGIERNSKSLSRKKKFKPLNFKLRPQQFSEKPKQRSNKQKKSCGKGGSKWHESLENCPAKDQKCYNRQKLNHFSKACRFKKVSTVEQENDSDLNLFIDAVSTKTEKENPNQVL